MSVNSNGVLLALTSLFELLTVTLTGCKSLPAKSNEMCVRVCRGVS